MFDLLNHLITDMISFIVIKKCDRIKYWYILIKYKYKYFESNTNTNILESNTNTNTVLRTNFLTNLSFGQIGLSLQSVRMMFNQSE